MREPHLQLDYSPSTAAAAAAASEESLKCLRAERYLASFYSLSFICCIASSTGLGWVWQHWSWTLNVCTEMDCGCIMYGASGFQSFKGGEAKLCLLALWALAPPLVVSLVMGVYHGYRVLVHRNLDAPRLMVQTQTQTRSRVRNDRRRGGRRGGGGGSAQVGARRASAAPAFSRRQSFAGVAGEPPRRKSWLGAPAPTSATVAPTGYFDEEDCEYQDFDAEGSPTRGGRVIVVGPKKRSSFKQWVPAGFLAIILTCVCLGQAVLVTDGYASTCEQYRRHLARIVNANGNELQVINHRLGCGSIFDYMDYLHLDPKKYRHAGSVNTGILLQIALIASWLNFIFWMGIFAVNSLMARRRKESLDEKVHCCL